MTNSASQSQQTPETPRQSPETNVQNLNRKATEVAETDKNPDWTDRLENLRGDDSLDYKESIDKQTYDTVGYLQYQLLQTLVKLKKQKPGIDFYTLKKEDLMEEIQLVSSGLTAAERAALHAFVRVQGEDGPVKEYLTNIWRGLCLQAEEASKGWTQKLADSFRKDPVKTSALMLAGAAGIYVGYKALKGLWDWATGRGKQGTAGGGAALAAAKTPWLSNTAKVLAALGVLVVGGALGLSKAKELLSKLAPQQLTDLLKALREMKDLPERTRKQLEAMTQRAIEAQKRAVENAKKGLAQVREGVAQAGKRVKKGAEATRAIAENPQVQFNATKGIFKKIHFYYKRIYTPEKLDQIDKALDDIKTVKTSIFIALYETYKAQGSIPPAQFPGGDSKNKVDPRDLFIIAKGITDLNAHLHQNKKSETTIEELFIASAKNPIFRMNQLFFASVGQLFEKGSMLGLLSTPLGLVNVFNEMSPQEIERQTANMEHRFQASELTPEEKKIFKKVQGALFIKKPMMSRAASEAVKEAAQLLKIADRNFTISLKVLREAEKFFDYIKNETKTFLPKIHERCKVENFNLKENLNLDKLTFIGAFQLVSVAQQFNWGGSGKSSGNPMQDMALLMAVAGALDKSARESYISALSRTLSSNAEKESEKASPFIQNLQPNINKLSYFAAGYLAQQGIGLFNIAKPWLDEQFTLESIQKKGYMELILARSIQMPADAFAVLLGLLQSLGTVPRDLTKLRSANDFFQLILSRGGKIAIKKGEEQSPSGAVIEVLGHYFWVQPKQTWSNILKGDFPVKTYVTAAGPFVVLGAGTGFIFSGKKLAGLWGGVKWGLKFPLLAPWMGVKGAWKGVQWGIGTGAIGKQKLSGPFQLVADTFRNIGEKIGVAKKAGILAGFEASSVKNAIKYAHDLEYYIKASPLQDKTLKQRYWEEPLSDKRLAARRALLGTYNKKMAFLDARRFAIWHEGFFGFHASGVSGEGAKIAISELTADTVRNTANRAIDFKQGLRHLASDGAWVKRIEEALKTSSKVNLEADIQRILLEATKNTFTSRECLSLARRIKCSEDLAGLAKQILEYGKELLQKYKYIDDIAPGAVPITPEAPKPTPAEPAKPTAGEMPKTSGEVPKIKATFKTGDILKLARLKDELKITEFLKTKGIPAEAAETLAKSMAKTKDAGEIITLLERSGVEGIKFSEKLAALLRVGRALGLGAGGAGAIFSAGHAGSNIYEALTTNVEGRSTVTGVMGGLWTVNLAADVSTIATILGSTSRIASVGSVAALPLIPAMWVAEQAGGAAYERTLTSAEWGQKYSYDQLLHHFYSTFGSASIGESILGVITLKGEGKAYEKNELERKNTMRKMYRFLIAAQSKPEIFQIIQSQKSNAEKNSEMENVIHNSYSKYHEYFFRKASMPTNYRQATQFIADAQLFHEMMTAREKRKADIKTNPSLLARLQENKQDKLENISYLDDQYDIGGAGDSISKPKKEFYPDLWVGLYRKGFAENLKEQAPVLSANLESMDTSYLLHLLAQIKRNLIKIKDKSPEQKKRLENQYPDLGITLAFGYNQLRNYLRCNRSINCDIEILKMPFLTEKIELDELVKRLKDMNAEKAPQYQEVKKQKTDQKPAVYALFRLAQDFGYMGYEKEEDLKKFFHVNKATFQGVYWDGAVWKVNKPNAFDFTAGPVLNFETMNKIVTQLYENAASTIEHRGDSVFWGARNFKEEVRVMARKLQENYNKAVDLYKGTSGTDTRPITQIAPEK